MDSPLAVFVCGTYSDLSGERGAVLDAIQRLQLNHRSMEFFGARPERSIETCLDEVRACNILVVIVGSRYGTLVPGRGISYSEAEYEEGVRQGLQCLVYVREDASVSTEPRDRDTQETELLEKWKATLRERHTVASFKDSGELAVQVVADLARVIIKLEKEFSARIPHADAVRSPISDQLARVEPNSRVWFCQRFGDEERQLLHGLTSDSQGNIIIVGDFWGRLDFGRSLLKSSGDRGIFVAKFDHRGNHLWSKGYGDASEQVGVGVDADKTGALLIASAFSGVVDFGGGSLVSRGRYNVALAKLDEAGNHLWSRCFGDSEYHVPECIAVAPSGRVSIAGRFRGTIDFGCGRLKSQSNQTDIFLATFSPDGDCLWAKRYGGPYEQQTRSIAIDANGNIAFVGVFKGSIGFDGQMLEEKQPNDYCGFLAKLDEQGTVLWCKRFGEPDVEQGSEVAFDRRDGDLLAAGFIRNKLPSGVLREIGSVCVFARYDPEGVLRWSKALGPRVFVDRFAVASDGRILVTGHFEGVADFGLEPLVSAGGYDIFAAMFTSDGRLLWARRFGDLRQQFLVKGVHGLSGSIVLAGSFHGTMDFGAGPLVASGYYGRDEGSEDLFLAIFEVSTGV